MFVVINNDAVWGTGATEEAALGAAREWIRSSDEQGHHTSSFEVVSYHELRSGARGFAVLPASDVLAAKVAEEGGAITWEVVDGVAVTDEEAEAIEGAAHSA